MEELKKKTFISSEPFLTITDNDMRKTVEYYAAFAFPIIFARKVTEHWDDGSTTTLNVHLEEIVKKEDEFIRDFLRAVQKLFIEIVQKTAKEEEYDAVMVSLALLLKNIGGIDNLKIEHVLEFLNA
ncbi:MAG: hypothetical protein ABIL37_01220 [candidate division WOR-3 bacterium]